MIDKNTKVGQLMTTEVLFVHPNDPMSKVADIFNMNNIHHLPVIEIGGKIVGIVSKSDYYRVVHGFKLSDDKNQRGYNQSTSKSLLVQEVMTEKVATLNPEDGVMVAAGYFKENLFHAIPVVDHQGKLLGIITTYDLLNFAYSEHAALESDKS